MNTNIEDKSLSPAVLSVRSIPKAFLRLATVNILSSLLIPLSSTISVLFLGHLHEIHHLEGVALTGALLSSLYEALLFLRAGTTGITAQASGRGDKREMILILARNSLLALIIGIALTAMQLPIQETFLAILDVAPNISTSVSACFSAQIWGAPAILLNFVLFGWLLGIGQSRLVLLLAFVGTFTNIVMDYFLIVVLDLTSAGAGISQAANQYVTLLVGLLVIWLEVRSYDIDIDWKSIFNTSAIRETLFLNGNIMVARMMSLTTFLFFNYQSSAFGTNTYAKNALLIQVVLIGYACFDGLGFTVETLSGNFKGTGQKENLVSLMSFAVKIALLISLIIAGVCTLFPTWVFNLFTNHSEIVSGIHLYSPWLVSVLCFGSIQFALGGYYLGLAEGCAIRNSAFISFFTAFLPIAIWSSSAHSNHALWLAMSAFPAVRAIVFWIIFPKTLDLLPTEDSDLATN